MYTTLRLLKSSRSVSEEIEKKYAKFKEAISIFNTLKRHLMAHDTDDTVFTASYKFYKEIRNTKSKKANKLL